jgi:hypothetical protein
MEVNAQPHKRPLYPQEKSSWYQLDRKLGGPQSRSGRSGEEKTSQCLSGFEPPIIQPVVQGYTTELSRLLSKPFGSHERLGASWLYEQLLSFQEGFCSIVFVNATDWSAHSSTGIFLKRIVSPYV